MHACASPKRHVLVVDDDPLVCESVMMLLESEGHLVDRARSAQEALNLFQPGKFDLIITDFLMPTMTGTELAAAIKTRAPEQPVVLLTAFAERLRSAQRPLNACDLVIDKPILLEALREAVTKFTPATAPSARPR